MSFLGKIKQFMGIGGVKVELAIPPQIADENGMINGSVKLQSKSDQHMLSLEIKLEELWTTGRGEDKQTKTFDHGEVVIDLNEGIKAGEVREISFELPYEIIKSSTQELAAKKGALGAIGKLGTFANAEKSEYQVSANLDVQGTAFDPGATKPIKYLN